MTTANLLNVSTSNAKMAAQVDTTKTLQEENLEVAEIFASMMNQTVEFSNQVVDETSSEIDVSKTDSTSAATDSYDRYSYKDNKIDAAEEKTVSEKLDEADVDMEEVSEVVVKTLSEEYGVSEEEIEALLEDLGLSVFDLLNPQNLVAFVVELTGLASGEELLLDESFLSVMETLDNLAQDLMKDLNVDMEGLMEIAEQFEVMTEATEVPTEVQEVLDAQTQEVEVVETTETVEVAEETVKKLEVEVEGKTSEEKVQTTETKEVVENQSTEKETLTSDEDTNNNSLLNQNQNANEAVVTTPVETNVTGQVSDTSFTQFSSYASVDTVQIMEQIVEQMRVTISETTQSMEMQLNPENLGKVVVHISSEEGVVNAQFTANNEIVKEALEAQVATLRENLNQAGVKVDAIEVTIASHEFEQNLEQNQRDAQEEAQVQESSKRRNLTIDSLDELAGLMTEEEALVAQIMKDNGNSVDLTA